MNSSFRNITKRWNIFAGLLITLALLSSCKKDDVENKILYGLPVQANVTVIPGKIAQEWLLLNRDSLGFAVSVIQRLVIPNVPFPGVTGPDSQLRFRFTVFNERYGEATFTLQFQNDAGTVIDAINDHTSTTSVKTALLTTTAQSTLFNYTENIAITLATAGDVNSPKFVTGTSVFTGQGTTLTFNFVSPGATANFEGLIGGSVSATGANTAGQPAALALTFSTDHSADGTLTWEGQTGSLHFKDNAVGFIATNEAKIILD